MRSKKKKSSDGLLKGIMLAHLILLLHLVLFAGLGLLVVFLSGVMQHMLWIFLAGMAVVTLSGYLFYRRLKREGKSLGEALTSPVFQGRSVEVSLLGGMATLKLDHHGRQDPMEQNAIEAGPGTAPKQLEDPEIERLKEINDLARMLEKDLITPDEFLKAKAQLKAPKNTGSRV